MCRRGTAIPITTLVALVATACSPDLPERTTIELVGREPIRRDSVEEIVALTFALPPGDSVRAILRRPSEAAAGSLAGVVLVAGRETGREAASVIPGPLDAAVLAVEYFQELPTALDLWGLVDRLPEIRESAYRMPAILQAAGHFLAAQPEVDSERIALVGVSFGVPFAAAAADDPIFRGVALHHGGGDLGLVLRANLAVESAVLRSMAAELLAWYFRGLDPARHVGAIAPRPLLLINGTRDTAVPAEAALLLAREAEGPVRQIWLPHDHLMPGDLDVMRELADSTLAHFAFLRSPAPR